MRSAAQHACMQLTDAVDRWYHANPSIRRLWAIQHADFLRVLVSIEPTLDNDDVYPVWLSNRGEWEADLRSLVGCAVRLELLQEFPWRKVHPENDGVPVVELTWRDATL
jgi:hypothetical protein